MSASHSGQFPWQWNLDQGRFILEPTRTAYYNLSKTILKCKALLLHQSGCQNQELPLSFYRGQNIFLLLTLDAQLPSVTAQYYEVWWLFVLLKLS